MLSIDSSEVHTLLTMQSCIEAMRKALAELASGKAVQELRSVVPIEEGKLLGQMPGFLKHSEILGTKVITIFQNNHEKGLPSHQGVVLLFDSKDGSLKAAVDGNAITAIRTAAVSAVATDLLARKNAQTLCVLGSGEQARSHIEAMVLVRQIKLIKVWSRRREKAERLKAEMEKAFNISIQVCDTAEEAAADAEIICTVTASKEPVLLGEWVAKGVHVNAVGACKASDRELDSELVKQSEFFVDRRESAVHESGDYLIPLMEGVIDESHIAGEIGDLLVGKLRGRSSEELITVFESLGLAIEDLAAANFVYEEAVKRDLNRGGENDQQNGRII
ncbi:ornithine cyclodeaminase family protein [Falsibacillus albus]|uniref:Ornithine cyclodeaminase family protein n=1 Tax=Falsibacillus albus TaxID=2478915 RepID=A0A3L7JNJ5_9BACI|nr:ornithine cyclodeaminase family protein [Falsibacillus albus]RLQ92397.1 ornithine cyclodeaminase family protein [Falsibacillus albus]